MHDKLKPCCKSDTCMVIADRVLLVQVHPMMMKHLSIYKHPHMNKVTHCGGCVSANNRPHQMQLLQALAEKHVRVQ